jgi:hypothetical protein
MDDFARRYRYISAETGKIIAAYSVEHAAIIGDQRLHARWIEHMQFGNDVAVIAHFKHIGIAACQL